MKRRNFIYFFLLSLSSNLFYRKEIYANNFDFDFDLDFDFETIVDLTSYLPQDFYSAELIEDTFYVPIKTKGYILTFDLNKRNISKIELPKGAYPDIIFHSKEYGLIIGSSNKYPPIIKKNISSKKVSYLDEEYNKNNFLKENILNRLSIISIKDSPSGQKVFLGNGQGNPIIYTKNGIIPLYHPYFNKIQSYDAVWISETEILISSLSLEGKVLFFRLKDNKTDLVKEFYIKGPYRFSPIVNNKIILSTRENGSVFIFKVFKNNMNQEHNIEIFKSIRIPVKYHLFQRLTPFKILESFKWGKYLAYFNDVHWITENIFALTTRGGNSVILMNLNGEILSLKRNMNLTPTRFIGSRLPNSRCFFVSKSNSSQINLLVMKNQ